MIHLFGRLLAGAVLMAAPYCHAADPPSEALAADVVFLGEQHDNPAHHAVQAEWVAALKPRALVFEMLTPEQAAAATAQDRMDEAGLEAALGWAESGWPDFAMYYPIFAAAPEAILLGAGVPRSRVQSIAENGIGSAVDGARFGLSANLPEDELAARLDLQRVAHCDALPEAMLPVMVDVQRYRDAALARAALEGLERTGGPVVVITGNGHARADWGAPALMRLASPGVRLFSLGQGEDGAAPEGQFDAVLDAAGVDRGDPCAAFTN